MDWIDWLEITIPVSFVIGMAVFTRRYIKDVTAFLSAGRVCGRYVISVGDIANAISIIGILALVEVNYKTGFALGFWSKLVTPIGIFLTLYGYCNYRFRETKVQSFGQFLEMRYSRAFRIFAAVLRSLTEIMANMIMPALAARFFIYLLDLPKSFSVFGIPVETFNFTMFIVLSAAIFIIWMGGSLSIIITDTIQGFICYPLMTLFAFFLLYKFSWNTEILPVLSNRAAGENFLNPYDVFNLRDFNLFTVILGVLSMFLHAASWIGSALSATAAKSPHEQKMAGLMGTWRNSAYRVFCVLVAVGLIVFMSHEHFSEQAHQVRLDLADKIAKDIVSDPKLQENVISNIKKMPVQTYHPGIDKPLSEKNNTDTPYLNRIHDSLQMEDQAQGNTLFQQFRTLYYQQMLPVAFRKILPSGMLGLFCLLMILAMISTDDTRIFSSAITIGQDIILPLRKKEMTPAQHIKMIRICAVFVGGMYYIGSSYMAQLDYINLYCTLVCTMWMGGCGPVMIFGLYSRFGTTFGAWVSLITGMFMAVIGMFIQRNWADQVYPWLQQNNLVEATGKILAAFSRPFEPIVLWRMNAVKCPVNSYEWFFITMLVTLVLYIACSWLSFRKPFNLEKMLHRGKYSLEGERIISEAWSWKTFYKKLVGITPEFSFWDKVIAWLYLTYTIFYGYIGCFLIVVIWNLLTPWPTSWWGHYFLITFLIIPGVMTLISTVWFGIGGFIDMGKMFRDLENRVSNPLDNGRVEGSVSLADKAAMDKIDEDERNSQQ